ncbi:MAG: asparagine synthase (glutamine-hydrolyzing) [Alphaproteobacteria bacterium]|nr:asparagine synthase (glutamine-hydrolyzing) [Alphaproteobacteria bacterium]MBQ6888577.1 asparagine synthase (glutamine-hydrolyzing) [Lachnospiraceae bacterium]
MCGIYGCIGKTNIEKTKECIQKIRHRGPDSWAVTEYLGAHLAHTRLSILDTSDDALQPMVDVSGRYTIVYNGEVYNYIEMRKELELLGYSFRTNSDTEVILYAYIAWGKEFQYKCNGMWALAIWDDFEKKLFLSRDRFGVKPLYYYKDGGNFYFASEMKALFPIMHDRKINYTIFDRQDYFSYEATENSVIRDIHKIKAGHCAIYANNSLAIERWWNTLEHLIKVPTNYGEQVEMLRELFENACAIRMRSDVPVGTALSGGVDSSAVVGFMKHIEDKNTANINKNWKSVFVASMPGTSIDETEYARTAAEYVGLNINRVEINPNIEPQELYKYMYMCEDPYITSPVPFMQTYGEIASTGIKVTLDGHGADELFGGYSFDVLTAVSLDSSEEDIRRAYEVYSNMCSEGVVKTVSMGEFKKMLQPIAKVYDDRFDTLNNCLYEETHEKTLPTLLRCYEHYSMSNGLEIRMPFMDYRIVSFAFSIPWTSKIKDGFGKKIVRDMSEPYMSSKIVYRKDKIGFNSPMTEWLLDSRMKEFVWDIVRSRDFIECDIVNPITADIRLNEFYKKDKRYFVDGSDIWNAVMPYIWKKAMEV